MRRGLLPGAVLQRGLEPRRYLPLRAHVRLHLVRLFRLRRQRRHGEQDGSAPKAAAPDVLISKRTRGMTTAPAHLQEEGKGRRRVREGGG